MTKQKTALKCNFCGKVFKRYIGPKTYEIKCPKCGEYDVEPLNVNPGAAWHRDKSKYYSDLSMTRFNQGFPDSGHTYRAFANQEDVNAHMSTQLGIPNPRHKVCRKSVKSILPLVLVGGLAWLIYKYRT